MNVRWCLLLLFTILTAYTNVGAMETTLLNVEIHEPATRILADDFKGLLVKYNFLQAVNAEIKKKNELMARFFLKKRGYKLDDLLTDALASTVEEAAFVVDELINTMKGPFSHEDYKLIAIAASQQWAGQQMIMRIQFEELKDKEMGGTE